MVEREFEAALERMFAQSRPMPDADAFAARVQARLDRSWRTRTAVIGAAGVIGGALAVTQAFGSNLGGQVREASISSLGASQALVASAITQIGDVSSAAGGVGLFWATSAMMGAAAIFAAMRLFEEV